ncbi:MAG TPA: LysR substrate-binding domain-containing protein, partial [Hydrogenophaga sp.]
VLRSDHPLARRTVLQPQDFEGEAFVSLAPTDPYRQQIDAVLGAAGVQRRLRVESPSAVSVCALVQQGLGVAIVNPLTALSFNGQGLAVRRLSFSVPFHVAMVLPAWRSEHPLRAALQQGLVAAAAALAERLEPGNLIGQ